MPHAYPLLLDVTDRLIVIVGGGSVAVRKAKGLLVAGATRINCVALNFDPDLPAGVHRITEAFAPRHLTGASLVFAATDRPDVNDSVVREAHRLGLLVNRADVDEDEPGDFTTPAVWRDSAVMITVSAAGSASLAAAIRDDLGNRINPTHLRLAEALRTLRPLIRSSMEDPVRRRSALRDLASADAMNAMERGGLEALRQWLRSRYPEV